MAVIQLRIWSSRGTPSSSAPWRMPARGVLRRFRPSLVVKVVEEAGVSPQLLILAVPARVPAHGGLDRERVLAQALALGILREEVPCVVTGVGHSELPGIQVRNPEH